MGGFSNLFSYSCMLAAVDLPVVRLARVGIGSLTLGDLPVGKWRYLTAAEVEALRG